MLHDMLSLLYYVGDSNDTIFQKEIRTYHNKDLKMIKKMPSLASLPSFECYKYEMAALDAGRCLALSHVFLECSSDNK
jgi:hypothetical protein